MAVADEMQAADPVYLDRRDRRTAPLRERQLLPAGPYPVGGGPEVPVEVAPRAGRADDRVQAYRLQARVPLAAPAERAGTSSSTRRRSLLAGWWRRRRVSAARTWCRLARRKSFSASARGIRCLASGRPVSVTWPGSAEGAQGGTDGDDDRPAEGDGEERAHEAGAEETPADPGQRQELQGDHDHRDGERGAVLRDEERQRVQDPAQERAAAGDRSAQVRAAAAGQVAGVGQAFGKGHADPGADRGRQPGQERIPRLVGGERDGEDRRERRQRAVGQAGHRRLRALEQERPLIARTVHPCHGEHAHGRLLPVRTEQLVSYRAPRVSAAIPRCGDRQGLPPLGGDSAGPGGGPPWPGPPASLLLAIAATATRTAAKPSTAIWALTNWVARPRPRTGIAMPK